MRIAGLLLPGCARGGPPGSCAGHGRYRHDSSPLVNSKLHAKMIRPGCTAVAALGFFIAAAVIDPCAAQPIVMAPGDVAVGGSIENSQISMINKTVNNRDPAVLAALTKTSDRSHRRGQSEGRGEHSRA